MKWANRILFGLNLALCAGLAFALWFREMPAPAVGQWTYTDLIATMLTVVTVILGALAVLIGLAAIWGYQTISNHAAQKAVEAARQSGQEYLDSDAFTEKVRALASEHIKNNLPSLLEARREIKVAQEARLEPQPDQEWEDDVGSA